MCILWPRQLLRGAPDCPALQPVPKGSWRCPEGWPLPSPEPVFLSGLLLSVPDTQLQLPGGQKEGTVWGRPEPNPADPGCCRITKAASVFAAALTPSVSPLLLGGLSQTRPACSLSPWLSSGLPVGQSCRVCAFLLWFFWP